MIVIEPSSFTLNPKEIQLSLLLENAFLFLLSLRNKITLQLFFLLDVILGVRVVAVTLEGAPKWDFDILFEFDV